MNSSSGLPIQVKLIQTQPRLPGTKDEKFCLLSEFLHYHRILILILNRLCLYLGLRTDESQKHCDPYNKLRDGVRCIDMLSLLLS